MRKNILIFTNNFCIVYGERVNILQYKIRGFDYIIFILTGNFSVVLILLWFLLCMVT